MRLRDENKRLAIVRTAAKLFSEQSFDDVRLDDVAAAAGIGKGTVYIYFKNKEELYYTLVYDGLAEFVGRVAEELKAPSLGFRDKVKVIIRGLVDFSLKYPQLFEVMRTVGVPSSTSDWDKKRQEMTDMFDKVLRDGVSSGQAKDPHPRWTAVYFPSMVRAVMLYEPKGVDAEAFTDHIASIILNGIATRK